jgi:hypothetical protein
MNGPILRSDINTFVEQAKFADELMIGTRVCPPVPVKQIAGKYPIIKIGNGQLLTLGNPKPRAWSSEAPIIPTANDVDGYECFDYSVKQRNDTLLTDYYSQFGFDQQVMSAKMCKRWQMLKLENDIAGTIFNPSNFTAITAVSPYLYSNIGTPTAPGPLNFPRDLNAMKIALIQQGVNPARASMVMTINVWNLLTQSVLFQYYVRGNRPADSYVDYQPTTQNLGSLASLLNIKEVIIAYSYANVTLPNIIGTAPAFSAIWPDTYFWLGVIAEGDFTAGGAARTLFYEQAGAMFSTLSYPMLHLRSVDVEVGLFSIPKVIDQTNGVLLTTSYTGS